MKIYIKKLSIFALLLCTFSTQALRLPNFNPLHIMQYCAKKAQPVAQFIRHITQYCTKKAQPIVQCARLIHDSRADFIYLLLVLSSPKVRRTAVNALAATSTWLGSKLSISALSRSGARLGGLGAHMNRQAILKDLTGFTPNQAWAQAIYANRLDLVQALIAEGANLELQNHHETPLHLASRRGQTEIVRALINAHANLEAQNNSQETPLHVAAGEGQIEIVHALITAHANLAARNNIQETPLHKATRTGQIEIMRALIAAGANLEAQNDLQETPLSYGISFYGQTGTTRALRALIDAGANLAAQDYYGSTPLHKAVYLGHTEIVRLLVQAGANINNRDSHNKSVRDIARNQEIIDYLDSIENQKAHLQDAITHQDLQTTKTLVEGGAPVVRPVVACYSANYNSQDGTPIVRPIINPDENNYTPIHNAIGVYNPKEPTVLDKIARTLIDAIGKRATGVPNELGQTPLHIAAVHGNLRLAELLLSKGANPNARDNEGNTPLHFAHNLEITNQLIRHGADITLANNNGATPILSRLDQVWQPIFTAYVSPQAKVKNSTTTI